MADSFGSSRWWGLFELVLDRDFSYDEGRMLETGTISLRFLQKYDTQDAAETAARKIVVDKDLGGIAVTVMPVWGVLR